MFTEGGDLHEAQIALGLWVIEKGASKLLKLLTQTTDTLNIECNKELEQMSCIFPKFTVHLWNLKYSHPVPGLQLSAEGFLSSRSPRSPW